MQSLVVAAPEDIQCDGLHVGVSPSPQSEASSTVLVLPNRRTLGYKGLSSQP